MLFNVASINFNRYEAEDATQQGAAIMRDASMSSGGKSRLGARDVGKLTFTVHVPAAGKYKLAVEYAGIGFEAEFSQCLAIHAGQHGDPQHQGRIVPALQRRLPRSA